MTHGPYGLSDEDYALVRKFLDREERDPYRSAHEDPADQQPQAPEVYIAVPPCGYGIPARSGTVPGVANCCIYKLVLQDGTTDGVSGLKYELVPIREIGTGNQLTRTVYNYYAQAIPALLPPHEEYIRIKRDKFGRWLAGTTATQFGIIEGAIQPSVNAPPPSCTGGQCQWTWNGTCWTTDGCTTTSTSSTSSTSTTTPDCLCPPYPTTTTTQAPCTGCVYPPICGTSVGQCYFSSCSITDSTQGGLCPCTTTSTTQPIGCDCNTTSTAGGCLDPGCGGPGDNCGGNCTWAWDGTEWKPTYVGCASCPYPPVGTDICGVYVSYCGGGSVGGGPAGGPAGTGSFCYDVCCWCWNYTTNEWTLSNSYGSQYPSIFCCLPTSALGQETCYINGDSPCSIQVPDPTVAQKFCIGGCTCTQPSWTPLDNPLWPKGDCASCTLTLEQELKDCSINSAPGVITYPDCTERTGNCNCGGPTTSSTSTTPGGGTTPPPGPCECGNCYTTTTTSTTTTSPGQCQWQCSGSAWSNISNTCIAGYGCSAPVVLCQADCQIDYSICSTTTTASG